MSWFRFKKKPQKFHGFTVLVNDNPPIRLAGGGEVRVWGVACSLDERSIQGEMLLQLDIDDPYTVKVTKRSRFVE